MTADGPLTKPRTARHGGAATPPRRWPAARIALYGAIVGAFLALFLNFGVLLGGSLTGLAFWARLALGALLGAFASASLVLLRNRIARA